jgi:hypothetical protein
MVFVEVLKYFIIEVAFLGALCFEAHSIGCFQDGNGHSSAQISHIPGCCVVVF